MDNYEKNIGLIYKYLHNELENEEDKKLFERLLENDEEFRRLFDDTKRLLELSADIPTEIYNIDIEREWRKQQNKIRQKQRANEKILFFSKKSFYFIGSVAATIIIFIAVFFIFKSPTKKVVAQDSVISVQLPDNSEVLLNRNSEIKYATNFEKNRTVTLNGDAYFSVSHDANHPFVVSAGDYSVRVVGTKFYVSVDSIDFQVYVTSGVVKVYGKDLRDTITLKAGEKFTANETTVRKDSIKDNNFLAWKTGKIIFDNQKLSEIARILEKTYGVKIEFSEESLKTLTMTATFDNQSLESVIKVIEATLNVKIIKRGNKYIVIRQ